MLFVSVRLVYAGLEVGFEEHVAESIDSHVEDGVRSAKPWYASGILGGLKLADLILHDSKLMFHNQTGDVMDHRGIAKVVRADEQLRVFTPPPQFTAPQWHQLQTLKLSYMDHPSRPLK